MNESLQDLMMEATRLTQTGRLTEATGVIQRAFRGKLAPGMPSAPNAAGVQRAADAVIDSESGQFVAGSHTHASLTRDFKLYVPPGHGGRALPLVVMLHGCTQDPDDFAAGTGMNEWARPRDGKPHGGFFVLYPAQSQNANPQRCWNWFKHNHQMRGRGEPAVLAGMTAAVVQQYGIDARRVYVAGLSAGGAMAAIVGAAYPDIFAAVGVHSGLPAGAARNVQEALAVMRSGAAHAQAAPVPTIVFHGDQDHTVHPRNGELVIAAAVADSSTATVEQATSGNGRSYTLSTYLSADGGALAEHWLVHGAGHAWSGGSATGSYTDGRGPDATAAMLRFFFAHPLAEDASP